MSINLPSYCGLLPIYKPRGISSKDVSRRLWRFGLKAKMGHVGTLDPGAEGVLPLLLGKATILQDLLVNAPKAYTFSVLIGYETDTLDADGLVQSHQPFAHVTREALLASIPAFIGEQEQIPPAYSAVKFQGQPLYKSARNGNKGQIDRQALRRKITIYSLSLDSFSHNLATFTVHCSKGTYVRVLAQDLMAKVGTCGTVVHLKRIMSAGITLADCIELSTLESALAAGESIQNTYVQAIHTLALGLPVLQLAHPHDEARILAGQELPYSRQNFVGISGESWDNSNLGSTAGASVAHREVLLLKSSGSALGLARFIFHTADRITVRMKRSLL
jgi:tRNA pseudouridine55 synthase